MVLGAIKQAAMLPTKKDPVAIATGSFILIETLNRREQFDCPLPSIQLTTNGARS
jgi:hypothetical protein